MWKPHLKDMFWWKGDIATVVGLTDRPMVIIQLERNPRCPHCKGVLDIAQETHVISSPNFQNGVTPIKTIEKC